MPDENEFLRKPPRQSRSRSMVDAIVKAADEFLSRSEDPDALSLEALAKRAGVGIGSLYDYFANRDGVFGAFLARLTDANFAQLEAKVHATRGQPFTEALPALVDATLEQYLAHPRRTRAAVLAIGRLGWIGPVVKERDRFAHVVAARLREEHPHLTEARTQLVGEIICDCIIGVVLGELWRERDPERAKAVRDELVSLVQARVVALLG
ncbi:MAG: TetR/AcrR family transcriptional regulator [Myxococcaceae bacterium]